MLQYQKIYCFMSVFVILLWYISQKEIQMIQKSKYLTSLNLILALLLTSSCQYLKYKRYHHKYSKYKTRESKAVVHPFKKGDKLSGWVHFKNNGKKQGKKQVLVTAKITGLEPNKKYGFHIHEYGDCSDQGQHVGKHYNPYFKKHGSLENKERHLGDMGNLLAGPDGTAFYSKILNMCMWGALGRSIVIHAHTDDGKTQPSGNAGPYLACGIIGTIASAESENIEIEEDDLWGENDLEKTSPSTNMSKKPRAPMPAISPKANPKVAIPKPILTSAPAKNSKAPQATKAPQETTPKTETKPNEKATPSKTSEAKTPSESKKETKSKEVKPAESKQKQNTNKEKQKK